MNLTIFCCVLRVTWCHHVRFSCYLRQKRGAINVCELEVISSRPVQHIRRGSVECEIHSPKFTHNFTLGSQIHETVKFVRNSYEFAPISTVSLSHSSQSLSLPLFVTMYQHSLSPLASLQSRPDAGADTLAQYQALPVAPHQMDEGTHRWGALSLEDVVAWAASLNPAPEVIHLHLRSQPPILTWGGRPGPQFCGRNSASGFPPFVFAHPPPTRHHGPTA